MKSPENAPIQDNCSYHTSNGFVRLELTVESMKHRVATLLSERELELQGEIAGAVEQAVADSRWRERLQTAARQEVERLVSQITQSAVRDAFQQSEVRERMTSEAAKAAREAFNVD